MSGGLHMLGAVTPATKSVARSTNVNVSTLIRELVAFGSATKDHSDPKIATLARKALTAASSLQVQEGHGPMIGGVASPGAVSATNLLQQTKKVQPRVDMKADTKSVPKTNADMKADTKSVPKMNADMKADTKSVPKTNADMKADTKSVPKTNADMKADTKSVAKTAASGQRAVVAGQKAVASAAKAATKRFNKLAPSVKAAGQNAINFGQKAIDAAKNTSIGETSPEQAAANAAALAEAAGAAAETAVNVRTVLDDLYTAAQAAQATATAEQIAKVNTVVTSGDNLCLGLDYQFYGPEFIPAYAELQQKATVWLAQAKAAKALITPLPDVPLPDVPLSPPPSGGDTTTTPGVEDESTAEDVEEEYTSEDVYADQDVTEEFNINEGDESVWDGAVSDRSRSDGSTDDLQFGQNTLDDESVEDAFEEDLEESEEEDEGGLDMLGAFDYGSIARMVPGILQTTGGLLSSSPGQSAPAGQSPDKFQQQMQMMELKRQQDADASAKLVKTVATVAGGVAAIGVVGLVLRKVLS